MFLKTILKIRGALEIFSKEPSAQSDPLTIRDATRIRKIPNEFWQSAESRAKGWKIPRRVRAKYQREISKRVRNLRAEGFDDRKIFGFILFHYEQKDPKFPKFLVKKILRSEGVNP